jgi:predicted nucleotide-binding protein
MNTGNFQLELKNDLVALLTSVDSMNLSFEKCQKIGLKNKYNFEEQESFDSLSSKFARVSDIYTQKILKTIFILLRENPQSFIDKANLAEKLFIISSSENLIAIRDLRNEIVHEYVIEELPDIYKEIFSHYKNLVDSIKTTESFVKDRAWVK